MLEPSPPRTVSICSHIANGETRTRTGDAAIFRRRPDRPERRGLAGETRPSGRGMCCVPTFAGVFMAFETRRVFVSQTPVGDRACADSAAAATVRSRTRGEAAPPRTWRECADVSGWSRRRRRDRGRGRGHVGGDGRPRRATWAIGGARAAPRARRAGRGGRGRHRQPRVRSGGDPAVRRRGDPVRAGCLGPRPARSPCRTRGSRAASVVGRLARRVRGRRARHGAAEGRPPRASSTATTRRRTA